MTRIKKEDCCPPSREKPISTAIEGKQADEDLAILTKALGHPARIQILRLLLQKQTCVCGEIVDEVSLAQSTVSQHLKVLKDAGLIRGNIDGPKVCYCIDNEMLKRLKVLIASL